MRTDNCIPTALMHLFDQEELMRTFLEQKDHHRNVYAHTRGHRSYLHAKAILEHGLVPSVNADIAEPGHYLIHAEYDGNPHCVALHVAEGQSEYVIWDGKMRMTVTANAFASCVANATDKGSLVLFRAYKTEAEAVWPDDVQVDDVQPLLELQAGGKRCTTASSSHADGVPVGADGTSDDDDGMEQTTDVADDTCQDDDESVVNVGDDILALMRSEVQDEIQQNSGSRKATDVGVHCCTLCPFRTFDRRTRLLHHLRTYHSSAQQHCCSGTKQLKVVVARHDEDKLTCNPPGEYLARSAALMRQTIKPPLSPSCNHIDRFVRLVLTEHGPQYWNHSVILQAGRVRRVRNIHYMCGFAEILYRECLLHNAMVSGMRNVWKSCDVAADVVS